MMRNDFGLILLTILSLLLSISPCDAATAKVVDVSVGGYSGIALMDDGSV